MTKGKKIPPMFTTKPEPEFVVNQAEQPEPTLAPCPNCNAALLVKIAGGDATLVLVRCQQCGTQYKLEFGKLVTYRKAS